MTDHPIFPRRNARFGYVPDLPDPRDFLYAPSPEVAGALPSKVDLRPADIPIVDQGQLGSCTGNGIAGVVGFAMRKAGEPVVPLSRLFVYYEERTIEGTVDSDSGAQIRDGIKVVHKEGVPAETDWPYDIAQFKVRPPQQAYSDALRNLVTSYHRVPHTNPVALKGCLAEGWPIVFGFTVFESFESQQVAQTGHVPMPQHGEQVVGGHCTVIVGYDDQAPGGPIYIVRNSWGTGWGDHGYCHFPQAYLQSRTLASDFWTVRRVA